MADGFLPLMEETWLVIPHGRWIVDEVCRQLAAGGPAVANVAVNAANRELWHKDLSAHVLASLSRHDLTPNRLTSRSPRG